MRGKGTISPKKKRTRHDVASVVMASKFTKKTKLAKKVTNEQCLEAHLRIGE